MNFPGGFGVLQLVVGGVTPGEGAAYGLAVHNPSRREPSAGDVWVDESLSAASGAARLAGGFELGRLVRRADGSSEVEPLLDYRSGLFQVVVVCPSGPPRPTRRIHPGIGRA